MTVSEQSRRLAGIAALAADEKQASNIAVIDVSDVMAISDVFVIASADNERQVRSIVEEIEDALTSNKMEPLRREGNRENRWVLLDYGSLVVHVQREQEREFYGLDRLYRDCPLVEIEGIETPQRPGEWSEEVDLRQVQSLEEIPLAAPAPDEDDA
ncbi:ribosome silencing factor [Corynebacterium mastitidis]|uniref:Ribosomal silencing factor RsfS n=1 Tax=Corynebacterium mastitidis TaxID=161890 RepID=A0A2N0X8G8_9CORY|nr:ribosome silencing factor [Corynebacterium mastitidis]MCH6196847.1 ribosome silencing factor [Corynebacterium mastitidis]MDK8449396.1 ribosome silencing factor [Corynebacterium mastitidis]PKF68969.1 ribosome silencing factor [Corynebacterium mastitidis]